MLNMIIIYLPILGIAILINIILGMYYNIGISCECFNIKKLLSGVIKSVVIASAFIGLAYCFDATQTIINIGTFELNPELIMTSAITIYMVKDTMTLASILGVKKANPSDTDNPLQQKDPLEK